MMSNNSTGREMLEKCKKNKGFNLKKQNNYAIESSLRNITTGSVFLMEENADFKKRKKKKRNKDRVASSFSSDQVTNNDNVDDIIILSEKEKKHKKKTKKAKHASDNYEVFDGIGGSQFITDIKNDSPSTDNDVSLSQKHKKNQRPGKKNKETTELNDGITSQKPEFVFEFEPDETKHDEKKHKKHKKSIDDMNEIQTDNENMFEPLSPATDPNSPAERIEKLKKKRPKKGKDINDIQMNQSESLNGLSANDSSNILSSTTDPNSPTETFKKRKKKKHKKIIDMHENLVNDSESLNGSANDTFEVMSTDPNNPTETFQKRKQKKHKKLKDIHETVVRDDQLLNSPSANDIFDVLSTDLNSSTETFKKKKKKKHKKLKDIHETVVRDNQLLNSPSANNAPNDDMKESKSKHKKDKKSKHKHAICNFLEDTEQFSEGVGSTCTSTERSSDNEYQVEVVKRPHTVLQAMKRKISDASEDKDISPRKKMKSKESVQTSTLKEKGKAKEKFDLQNESSDNQNVMITQPLLTSSSRRSPSQSPRKQLTSVPSDDNLNEKVKMSPSSFAAASCSKDTKSSVNRSQPELPNPGTVSPLRHDAVSSEQTEPYGKSSYSRFHEMSDSDVAVSPHKSSQREYITPQIVQGPESRNNKMSDSDDDIIPSSQAITPRNKSSSLMRKLSISGAKHKSKPKSASPRVSDQQSTETDSDEDSNIQGGLNENVEPRQTSNNAADLGNIHTENQSAGEDDVTDSENRREETVMSRISEPETSPTVTKRRTSLTNTEGARSQEARKAASRKKILEENNILEDNPTKMSKEMLDLIDNIHQLHPYQKIMPDWEEVFKQKGVIPNKHCFTLEEDKQLLYNYKHFFEDYPCDWKEDVFNIKLNSFLSPIEKKERTEFLKDKDFIIRLGRGLKRPIYAIVGRMKRFLQEGSSKPLSEEDQKKIERLYHELGACYKDIAERVGVGPLVVQNHINKWTKNNKKAYKSGHWTTAENETLFSAIRKVTGRHDINELREGIDWQKVSEIVATRSASQCRSRWLGPLQATTSYEKITCEQKVEFIDLLTDLEAETVHNQEFEAMVPKLSWVTTAQCLKAVWHQMKVKIPGYEKMTTIEIIENILLVVLPELKNKLHKREMRKHWR